MKRFIFAIVLFIFPVNVFAETYIKTESDRGVITALKTAVVHFDNKDGIKVALVGVIHIGDRDYYKSLNKHME